MTPEEAESIYIDGCNAEYKNHQANYDPVNQKKVTLAGFAAVIEAVEQEQTVKFVHKYLEANP